MKRTARTDALALVLMGVFCALPGADASAETAEVTASQDLTVRRGDRDNGPVKERSLHPKKVSAKDKNRLDRFILMRFDAEGFGKDVRAAALLIHARDNETFEGRHRFRVYGVRDGDKEDEKFTENDYQPGADGALFDNSTNMLDRKQAVILGTYTAERGKAVQFTSASLTAFVRSDRNGTVTLVITRETEAAENSVFEDRTGENPPRLKLLKKEE